jgi:hypothetical protein
MNRPHLRHIRLLPGIFALALAATACDVSIGEHGFSMDVVSGKAQDEWKRSYTLAAGGHLEIENINGTITASPADGNQVEVRAERIAKAGSDEAARELLKKISIEESETPERVRIETKVPKMSWGRSGHEVRYWVKVPKGLAVNFETTNGGVRLENIEGEIVASTTNGGVRGSGLRGSVNASTTNGGVQIEMAAVTGDITLDTTNGGIRLQLPPDTKANLDASCVNGGVSVDDFTVEGEKSRRRVTGTINGGGPKIEVETVNGGVRVSAGSGATAETR